MLMFIKCNSFRVNNARHKLENPLPLKKHPKAKKNGNEMSSLTNVGFIVQLRHYWLCLFFVTVLHNIPYTHILYTDYCKIWSTICRVNDRTSHLWSQFKRRQISSLSGVWRFASFYCSAQTFVFVQSGLVCAHWQTPKARFPALR